MKNTVKAFNIPVIMKAKIYTLLSVMLLVLSMPVQAQNEVKRLDKLFGKTLKDIVGGITSANTENYGDEYVKSYVFTIPRSQAKVINRLDETLIATAPKAYKSWIKKAGGDLGKTMTVRYGEDRKRYITFGKSDKMNYNLLTLKDTETLDKYHVYALVWGENGDDITGGIFQFYSSATPSAGDISDWFYIIFNVGGCYLTAKGDGALVKTDSIKKGNEDAALWRWVKAGNGYHFFNKQGYQLYFDGPRVGGRVKAGSTAYGTTEFYIIQSEREHGLYEISIKPRPQNNDKVYLNQMGGVGKGLLICLYYSSVNPLNNPNCVQFVDESGALVTPGNVFDKAAKAYKTNVEKVDTAEVDNGMETKVPHTGADFMEQLNNLATLFTTEGNWCLNESKSDLIKDYNTYSYHINLWTGATNKIMRLCKEHADLLDKDERAIVYNLLAKLKLMCYNSFDSLGPMLEVAQKAVKK